MKILKSEKTANLCTFEIEADFAAFKEARSEVITSFAKEMKVPGFRPGKAPKDIVEKNLNPEAVNDRASQHLISTLYPEIIKETLIDPVDYPNVEVVTLEEGKPFVFTLKVEVYPEVKIGKYKGIPVAKKPTEVTEDELLKVLGNLQDRFAKQIEIVDGAVQFDDLADMEIQAEAEGAQIKRWPRNLEHFPVGKGYISPEFDAAIEGLKPGESKNFSVKLPQTYSVSEIAGKEVNFAVKIVKIRRKELAPLDDEFAKMVSSFGSLAELKQEVKKNLEMEKKEEAEADLKNQLIESVAKEAKTDIPDSMVRIETDVMIDELKSSLSRSNLTLADYLKSINKSEESMRSELKTPATARTKGKLVLKKVAEVENLVVAPHDLDTEIALMAQGSDKSTEEYKKTLGHGGIAYITDYLLRRKALDFLISQANIKGD